MARSFQGFRQSLLEQIAVIDTRGLSHSDAGVSRTIIAGAMIVGGNVNLDFRTDPGVMQRQRALADFPNAKPDESS